MFYINERGIIQQVNTACSRVFGWSEEEFIGENISMIMPDGHSQNHDSYLERYLKTGFKKFMGKQREVEAKRKDGSRFPCILGISELKTNGQRNFVGFVKDVSVEKTLLIAEAERQASDSLLFNILPEHIAERLKQDPGHIADHYENTTILFADIVGFTDRATSMSPHDVVTMLNDLFSRFDYLVGHYDLNKVKTIGDCYMVTSIPSSELEHDGCARVCRFALDLMKSVRAFNAAGPQHGHVELRVGIACGQVVAGVVGTKRFLFDMWGDAVNVAARMEQHGLPGQIQCTKDVVDNAGRDFSFECRGQLAVKGKGMMETYLLKSAKDAKLDRRSVHYGWKPSTVPTQAVRANSLGNDQIAKTARQV
jgi:PAS domain S-box-containing protein